MDDGKLKENDEVDDIETSVELLQLMREIERDNSFSSLVNESLASSKEEQASEVSARLSKSVDNSQSASNQTTESNSGTMKSDKRKNEGNAVEFIELEFELIEEPIESRICTFLKTDDKSKNLLAVERIVESILDNEVFISSFISEGGVGLLLTKLAVEGDEEVYSAILFALKLLAGGKNRQIIIQDIDKYDDGIASINKCIVRSASASLHRSIINLLFTLVQSRNLREEIQFECFRAIVENIVDPAVMDLIKSMTVVIDEDCLTFQSMRLVRNLTSFSLRLHLQDMRDCGNIIYNLLNIVHNGLVMHQLHNKFVETCLCSLTNLVPEVRSTDENPKDYNDILYEDSSFCLEDILTVAYTSTYRCDRTSCQLTEDAETLKRIGGELVRYSPTARILCRVLSELKPGDVQVHPVIQSIRSLVFGHSFSAEQVRAVVIGENFITNITDFLFDSREEVVELVVLTLKSLAVEQKYRKYIAINTFKPILQMAFTPFSEDVTPLSSVILVAVIDLLTQLMKNNETIISLFQSEEGIGKLEKFLHMLKVKKNKDTWLFKCVNDFLERVLGFRRPTSTCLIPRSNSRRTHKKSK